jgi:hypothetical protein
MYVMENLTIKTERIGNWGNKKRNPQEYFGA